MSFFLNRSIRRMSYVAPSTVDLHTMWDLYRLYGIFIKKELVTIGSAGFQPVTIIEALLLHTGCTLYKKYRNPWLTPKKSIFLQSKSNVKVSGKKVLSFFEVNLGFRNFYTPCIVV